MPTQTFNADLIAQGFFAPAPDTSSLPGDGDESGVFMAGDGFVYGGTTYALVTVSSGTLGVGLTLDGKLTAGAGAVTLDEDGLTLFVGTGDENHLKFVDSSDGRIMGMVEGDIAGTATPNRQMNTTVYATGEGTGYAGVNLYPIGGDGKFGILKTFSTHVFTGGAIQWTEPTSGQVQALHRGDYAGSFQTSIASASAVTLYSRTIKANSMGAKGWVYSKIAGTILNNSGAGRTYHWVYNFGAYSLDYTESASITNSATSEQTWVLEVWTFNDNATNAQYHIYHFSRRTTTAAETLGAATEDIYGFGKSAIDTTADRTLSIQRYSSNAAATQTARGVVYELGPYYAA